MHRSGVNLQEQFLNISRQMEDDFIYPTTVAECSSMLRTEAAKLQTIIHDHHNHRQNERATQIAALNATGIPQDKAKATILRLIQVAEDISTVHRKIETQMKRSNRESITRVEMPLDSAENPRTCTQWKVVDVPPSEVLNILQQCKSVHFGQAHGSPFTVDPLIGTFGYGCTLAARQVLNGNFDFDTITDTSVAAILKHLTQQQVCQQDTIKPEISLSAFTSKLKS